MKLREIAKIVGGVLYGDGEVEIKGISSLADAEEGELTFLFRKSYLEMAKSSRASAVLTCHEFAQDLIIHEKNLIISENPQMAYLTLAKLFEKVEEGEGFISSLAYVCPEVSIGENVRIYPFVYVGSGTRIENGVTIHPFVHIGRGVFIGENTKIYPNVTIYDGVSIGKRVIVHSGTVIGSDGFGYIWDGKKHLKIPHLGKVEIEDDVEIGANVTIDRAALGRTVIKRGTKIDNLVQIGHNVTVGEDCIIVAQVGIGGSVEVGKRVVIAGQAGIRDHVKIGDDVKIGGQSGVTKDVEKGSEVMGTPHMEHKKWARLQVYLKQLPELFVKVREIEKKLKSGEYR